VIARILITALALGVGGGALAMTGEAPCQRDAHGMSSTELRVWESGLVLDTYTWGGEGAADEVWKETAAMRLIDCKSGDFILVSRPTWHQNGEILSERHTRVVEALATDDEMTLATFLRKMNRAGAFVARHTENEESCSCSVHFPELRGDKKPFRGTDG